MSLLWGEPWDQYGGDEAAAGDGPWAAIAGWEFSTTKPRSGLWSLYSAGAGPNNSINVGYRRLFGGPKVTAGVGYAFFTTNLPAVETGFAGLIMKVLACFLTAAGDTTCIFVLGTDGSIAVYSGYVWELNGGMGTLLYRSAPCVRPKSYNHLEFKLKTDPAAGEVEVRVNGVTVINLTGVDTGGFVGASESSQFLTTAGHGSFIGTGAQYLDDLFAWDDQGAYDNDFIGDKKAYWLKPVGDTAQADWTPSAGATSYGVVDEAPPDDADYLSIVGTGKTNLVLENLPADVVSVAGVVALMRAWKSDAGTCDFAPGVVQGATYSTPVGQTGNTAPQYYQQVIEVDPVSGAPFTPADVNSLNLVVERSA